MSTSQSPLSIVLLLVCLPLLGALTAGLLGLSFPIGLLPVALTAGVGAWLGTRFRHPTPAAPARPAAPNPAESLAQGAPIPTHPAQTPALSAESVGQPDTHNAAFEDASIGTAEPAPIATEADPKLRHDIRNILSPAMLAAEQLATSTDPLVLKAVRTIDESLDRALLRLKQKPQS
ncbi:hypothetical protein [Acetobacter orleanensis]|uniref:Uncharacterized protein n=1 Tax=Acetobacter orleanensis TaxID=104099 RepID=A0A4Y3TLQ3_9PROT|nr:hypothetical protein [Acetobacter orleanensis]KXV66112.1 hypothetical protein AD949_03265 [Acetobacter orleanensis]PCD79581.1 hypothetical protein CO710_04995 [Acetobacter orleanensis]GAN68667.1 hypothetical protein Abol_021_022 [Acetobacter orleanensis JCM 7639]GBR24745.1 hypothetical protein AA0473_0716 [Acetobacter orleanensis NRIC 0473]GEB82359.1 hypothetical protein AOR01nite_08360 [Acetobacter orleanensis]